MCRTLGIAAAVVALLIGMAADGPAAAQKPVPSGFNKKGGPKAALSQNPAD
mgnify:CR=1 FL=1